MTLPLNITVTDEKFTPRYAHDGDAGLDLRARIDSQIHLYKGARVTVPTGVFAEIPPGYFGMVCPRSGLAQKHGLTVANAPGIIDSTYTGEICVILQMHGDDPVTINPFDRIAQLVIAPYATASINVVESIGATARGTQGFGSTGLE